MERRLRWPICFHFCAPVVGGREEWHYVLDSFVDFIRGGGEDTSPDVFFAAIDTYLVTTDQVSFDDTAGLLRLAQIEVGKLRRERVNRQHLDTLDPAIPCLADLCNAIGSKLGRLKLVCDRSKVVERHARTLLNIGEYPDPARPGQKLHALPVVQIDFADSMTSDQLQIADWVAGATRQCAASMMSPDTKQPPNELRDLVQGWMDGWLVGALWPDREAITNPRVRNADYSWSES